MKRIGKIKRAVTLGLIFLLSINNFATSVANNDGSAFITKAEFDALKSSFQSQIDTYNQGIDSKIDNAIASYLSGMKISEEPYIILTTLNGAMGGQVWFKNGFYDVGESDISTNFNLNFTRHYTYQYNDNIKWTAKIAYSGNRDVRTTGNSTTFGIGIYLGQVDNDGTCEHRIAYSENVYFEKAGDADYNFYTYDAKNLPWGTAGSSNGFNYKHASTTNVNSSQNETTAGAGKAWIFEKKPSGRLTLKQYASTLYPRQNIEIVSHTYKDLYATNWATFKPIYVDENGRKDTTDLGTLNIPSMSGWDDKESGTKITGTSTTAKAQYYRLNQVMIKSTDGKDYSIYMWGKNSNTGLYCQDMNATPTVGAKDSTWTATKTKSTFQVETYKSYTVDIYNNELSGQAFTYYPITMSTDYLNANACFTNDYVSQVFGEDVHIGDGIPILRTAGENQKLHIKLKFKSQGVTSNPTVNFKISDEKFNNNAFATGATLLHEKNGLAVGTPYEFDITVNNKDQNVWFTCYANTATDTDVAIDTFECKLVN